MVGVVWCGEWGVWSEYGEYGEYGGVVGVVGLGMGMGVVGVQDSGELWRTFGGEKYGPGVELRSTISPPPRIVIK